MVGQNLALGIYSLGRLSESYALNADFEVGYSIFPKMMLPYGQILVLLFLLLCKFTTGALMHVFQLESKTVFLHPPLYNFNDFSRQLQDAKRGSESCTAIWSCYRKALKADPRGQKGTENLLARACTGLWLRTGTKLHRGRLFFKSSVAFMNLRRSGTKPASERDWGSWSVPLEWDCLSLTCSASSCMSFELV